MVAEKELFKPISPISALYKKNNKTYNKEKYKKRAINPNESSSDRVKRIQLQREIDFDTFQSDLISMSKTIEGVRGGWQSADKMSSTRSSLISMQNRIDAYQEYQKQYGGTDLSELQNAYKSVLDGWDDLSSKYGMYKNADAYQKEQAKLNELYGMNSSDVKKAMQENSKLEDKLKTAKEYEQNIMNLTRSSINMRNPSAVKSFSESVQNAIKERDDYLKSIGYDSIESLEKAVSGVAYTTADGYNIKWQDLYNDAHLSEYTQEIMDNPDFAKTNGYKEKDVKYTYYAGYGTYDNEFAHIYNLINGDKDAKEYEILKNVNMYNTSDTIRYEYFTPDEKLVFNSIAETQGEEKALEYAELLSSNLRQRRVAHENEENKKMAEEIPGGSSAWSVIANVGNNAVALPFLAMDYLDDGSIDKNSSLYTGRRMVNTTRSTVEGMIDNDVGQFFYRHGMNTADNVAAMAVSGFGRLGVASKVIQQVIMSSGAVVDTAIDAKSRGLTDGDALGLGMIAGAAEWAFESKAFDALFDSKTLRQSGWKYFVNNLKTEMVGEFGTELTNDIADVLLSKELNKWRADINSYIASGMSEKEAFTKAFKETGLRYLDVAAGTLFSTSVISGTPAVVGSVQQHSFNKNNGQTIKANERVGEVFDIASNPEVASAYDTYTRYANKGINADNISDAQLGRLYTEARADAVETSKSKKSTVEQKKAADKMLADLDTYAQDNPSARTDKKAIKSKYNDADTIDALISEGLESAEGTESHTLATEYKAKIDSGKKLSTTEISNLIQANEKAIKSEETKSVTERLVELGESSDVADIVTRKIRGEKITLDEAEKLNASENGLQVLAENGNEELVGYVKTMENGADANLFISLYDGETDVEAYANSFNLVTEYAKNDFSFDYIFKNKGVLSAKQVSAIYAETRIKSDREKTDYINKLNKQMEDKKFYKGHIDDTIIDYDNTSAEDKVNWYSLSTRQRQAVVFLKGFAQATGVKLVFEHNSKSKYNGNYDPDTNTITIDIAKWADRKGVTKETIIPTMSHELTHWMKKKAPELWRNLNEIVFKTLVEHYNSNTEQALKDKAKLLDILCIAYSEETLKSQNITEENLITAEYLRLEARNKKRGLAIDEDALKAEAREEIIARACEDMLKMSERGKRIFTSLSENDRKTLIEKIKGLVNDLLNWVNDLLNSYESTSTEARIMREYKEELQKAAKIWDEMLGKSIKANQSLEKSGAFGNKNSEGDVVYALREEAISEVEQAISNKNYDKEIKLTDSSPAILTSQKGVKNLPMMIKASHARENILTEDEAKALGLSVRSDTHFHGLGKDLFLKVIDGLDEVTRAYRGTKNAEKSERRENYFLLISQYIDSDGNTINVPVYINEGGMYNEVYTPNNKIATVFGKRELEAYIQREIRKGNLVRIKNRSTQVSESSPPIGDNYNKNASKDSIRNSIEKVNTKFSDRDVSLNMSEDERYEILKEKQISPVQVVIDETIDIDFEYLENNIKSVVEKPLVRKLRSLGHLKKYKTDVIDVEFELTGKGVNKSLHSQVNDYGGNFADFAKVILNLQSLLDNSVLLEIHSDKGKGTKKENPQLKQTFVLFSAFQEGKFIKPVQFEIKEYVDENNRLYLAVALTKIETSVMGNTMLDKNQTSTYLLPVSNISISEIFSKINPYDKNFLKYIPNQFLNEEQIKAKNEALEIEKRKYSSETLYSEREDISVYDIMGEKDRLLKENEKFKADIERLNERLKIERKVTKGSILNNNQLLATAGRLRKISNSTIDKVELARSLKDVYSFIANSENLTWEEVFEKCYAVAEAMLEKAKPEVMVDDYYKQILKDIRNTRISLSESQKKEAQNIFDKNWNRYFFGSVIITDNGIGLESKWQEWASQYPGVFDADISDGDMIRELYDIISTLRESSEVVVEYNTAEQTRWLANEIYNQYWNVSPIRTTADKYDKQIKRLKFEHRKAMTEIRDDYNSRLKEQHKTDKEKYIKLAKEIRERKDKEIALAKQHGREMLGKYKENAERKTVVQRITANALTLKKWLEKNNKDYHIHEAMKGPVVKLLQAIDFSSKRMLEKGMPTEKDISFAEAFAEVRAMLQDADNMVEGLEALYGHDLAEDIKALSKATYNLVGDNSYVINSMSNEELKHLDRLVSHIKKVVSDLNKFHTVHHNQGAYSLANEFMEHGEKLGSLKKQHGNLGKFLEFRNRTPYYFFKDLGEVGEKLFEAFQDGWDKLAFNAKKVIDFAEETYTEKEVKKWSKETKEFKILQFDGSERIFKMSIAQIMALHCVSKQEDALRHLISGGMTLKRIDKKGHVVADYENISLSTSDIQSILSTLDDRQREVADKLQNFMNTVCSAWGNEISMARFGIEMFGLPDYFPIKVSEATVPTDNAKDIDNASLFRLLNMSFTKSRNQYAEQSIEIGDVFDIFAQHASDMAKYNALALPVLDFNKFYSIHGKDSMGKEYGVVKTLKSVFGDEANGYLRRFVRDINGSQNVSRDVIGNTFFKNAKLASVANNLRVVLLQPTAYFKAGAVLGDKYLMKASAYINVEPIGMVKKLKKAISNAEKYCGIVEWKSLGYYDTDISKGITEKIKHAYTVKDKIIEKSMKGAEIADKVTFGTLWVACEFEIRDTRKDLKVGSDEFYNAVGKRLREVIYATQVVDSTMTRTDMMRSSDRMDKMLTTFGSEPAIAYNMLLDAVTQYKRDEQEFGKKEAVKKNVNHVRKVVTAYAATNIAAALVESAFDWLRDDEDEEMDMAEFLKLYFKNFAFDMSIGNKLPVVKELYSIMQGYSSSRLDTQWAQYLYSAINAKKPSKAIRDTIRLISQVSGYAFYNVYRDLMATLNKLDIFSTEDLNEMFEDFLD